MSRPKRCRRVCCEPGFTYFKPRGISLRELEKVEMGLDELEALRLADLLGLSQSEAAAMMDVSQPTFNRILASARNRVASCIVQGKALRVQERAIPDPSIEVRTNPRESASRCRHARKRQRIRTADGK